MLKIIKLSIQIVLVILSMVAAAFGHYGIAIYSLLFVFTMAYLSETVE